MSGRRPLPRIWTTEDAAVIRAFVRAELSAADAAVGLGDGVSRDAVKSYARRALSLRFACSPVRFARKCSDAQVRRWARIKAANPVRQVEARP